MHARVAFKASLPLEADAAAGLTLGRRLKAKSALNETCAAFGLVGAFPDTSIYGRVLPVNVSFKVSVSLSPRVLLWSGTGLLQQVLHHAAHHLPGPAPQHLHGHLRDRHLCLYPESHLLLLLHQVRGR